MPQRCKLKDGRCARWPVFIDKGHKQGSRKVWKFKGASSNLVLNRPCVTIITNAGSSIIMVYSVEWSKFIPHKKARTESNRVVGRSENSRGQVVIQALLSRLFFNLAGCSALPLVPTGLTKSWSQPKFSRILLLAFRSLMKVFKSTFFLLVKYELKSFSVESGFSFVFWTIHRFDRWSSDCAG